MQKAAEKILFDELIDDININPSPIFILAAPRTGSTSFYKSVIEQFSLPFIANITNEQYANTPAIGLKKQKQHKIERFAKSQFGKTKGLYQPSEGSAVFSNWFGGGHPSQVVSAKIIDEEQTHFINSLVAIEKLYGAPLLSKNAWNCFRVQSLATILPKARFIWLQRDIIAAASSDLQARYITKKDANSWNSATPANYQKLLKRPSIEQVIENQYEFNKAIKTNLSKFAQDRWINIWFEDYIKSPKQTFDKISSFLNMNQTKVTPTEINIATEGEKLPKNEQDLIVNYARLQKNHSRFSNLFYG